jgi:hypothetical protein
MTLLVDELYNGVVFEQNFRIKKHISIAHIRPWIYKHGILASGNLTCEVFEGNMLLKQVQIPYPTINTEIPSTYAHGQIRFDMNSLQLNHNTLNDWTEYTLKIYMSGYTNAATFIGAVRRYELKFTDTYGTGVINNEAPNDMVEPLGFELFEYKYR